MQIRGILRPDEQRARLTSRRGQRLHAADRGKRFLSEPAAGTEPVHAEPGLRGIDGDDRRHRRPALAHQHATPAVAGGTGERQRLLPADIGRLAFGDLIPPQYALV